MSSLLSEKQIMDQIDVLRSLSEEARKQSKEAEKTRERIDREIKELQDQCQHKYSGEMLLGEPEALSPARFCVICGARY